MTGRFQEQVDAAVRRYWETRGHPESEGGTRGGFPDDLERYVTARPLNETTLMGHGRHRPQITNYGGRSW